MRFFCSAWSPQRLIRCVVELAEMGFLLRGFFPYSGARNTQAQLFFGWPTGITHNPPCSRWWQTRRCVAVPGKACFAFLVPCCRPFLVDFHQTRNQAPKGIGLLQLELFCLMHQHFRHEHYTRLLFVPGRTFHHTFNYFLCYVVCRRNKTDWNTLHETALVHTSFEKANKEKLEIKTNKTLISAPEVCWSAAEEGLIFPVSFPAQSHNTPATPFSKVAHLMPYFHWHPGVRIKNPQKSCLIRVTEWSAQTAPKKHCKQLNRAQYQKQQRQQSATTRGTLAQSTSTFNFDCAAIDSGRRWSRPMKADSVRQRARSNDERNAKHKQRNKPKKKKKVQDTLRAPLHTHTHGGVCVYTQGSFVLVERDRKHTVIVVFF